jgi:hypothetical protein
MQATGTIDANGGKEVVTVERILKFTTVAVVCEKNKLSRFVVDSRRQQHPFFEWWGQGRGSEWVIVTLVAATAAYDGAIKVNQMALEKKSGLKHTRWKQGQRPSSKYRLVQSVAGYQFKMRECMVVLMSHGVYSGLRSSTVASGSGVDAKRQKKVNKMYRII